MPATSRQPEVTYTSCARLTLLRYSSGLEPGDSSPVHISPCSQHGFPTNCAALRMRAVTPMVKAAVHRAASSVFVYVTLSMEVSNKNNIPTRQNMEVCREPTANVNSLGVVQRIDEDKWKDLKSAVLNHATD